MDKILAAAALFLIFVGCCFTTTKPALEQFKVPDGPERPKLITLSIFKPEDGKFVKYKPMGRFVAPDDHYVGLSAREMESLLIYIKQLEAYADALKNHPNFEVNK